MTFRATKCGFYPGEGTLCGSARTENNAILHDLMQKNMRYFYVKTTGLKKKKKTTSQLKSTAYTQNQTRNSNVDRR